jgi:membrane protease YdiL (CAAX protease family)
MSIPPEFLYTPEVLSGPPPLPPPPPPRRIPNFGHTVLFFTVTIIVLLLTSISVFALAMGFHLLGTETPEQLLREPRLLIPSMVVAYLIAGAIVWAIFTYLWQQTFLRGMHWNFDAVRRRWKPLLGGGIVLSLVVQFLSNFLPVPKTLPIDDFFRNSADVWMVALFGTFVAPLFEELAFRGFLLPSLASAWDWLQGRRGDAGVDQDPHWSVAALAISCTITSIAFALVHADQLAHAWAPLAVLFGVSLVLCGVRLWTQSLAASTFLHATYNGTIFTILFFVTGGFRHLDKIK